MLAAVQAREAALLAAQRELVARSSSLNAQSFLAAQGAILLAILLGFFGAPIPALVAVLVLIAAFETVLGLPRAGVLYGQAAAAAARVVHAAEAQPPVPDPAIPAPMPSRNAVAFEHVSFSYAARPPAGVRKPLAAAPARLPHRHSGPLGRGQIHHRRSAA